jgi:hypothetical protein
VNKKKQKNFDTLDPARGSGTGSGVKVFWFFFSKKNCFLA